MARAGAVTRFALGWVLAALLLATPGPAWAQDGDGDTEPRDKPAWNGFDFGFTTLEYGFGLLVDYATYSQDDTSVEQIQLEPSFVLRDMRLLFRGRVRGGWGLGWTTGLMYDRVTNSVRFRQTGFKMPLPEPWGTVFLGRTKEGISLNKVLVGYYGWTMERYPFSDAVLPILADGVRWYGYVPSVQLTWSLGAYTDWVAHLESFSKDDYTLAARLAWVSVPETPDDPAIHVGVNTRLAWPNDGVYQARVRPESFSAPYFLDTGEFPSSQTRLLGGEAYYQTGPWLIGSEYAFMRAESDSVGDPLFHGGDVFVSRLLGNATRTYSVANAGVFGNVIPARTQADGGWGVWEAGLRFSYTDLTTGGLTGGVFWRITPTLMWHITSHVRAEFSYGFGELDRFDATGQTHFLQTRWQLQF